MKILFNRIVLLSLLSSSPALAQTTWFVDAAGTAPGNGTPSDPYTRVDFAVAQATTVSGDLVFVEPGIYQDEAIDFLGKDLHVFSRGATLRNNPPTVGFPAPPSLVTFANGETSACILEGFTLMGAGGHSTLNELGGLGPAGSGVWISGASPVIRDCTFARESTWSSNALVGGGIYVNNGSLPGRDVRIEDCVFQGLDALESGAAMHLEDASAVVVRSLVENGFAPAGAGIFAMDSDLSLEQVEFVGNDTGSALDRGCHGYVLRGSLSMVDCTSRGAESGAWFIRAGMVNAQECTFENNSSSSGGACFSLADSLSVFEDCQFIGNHSDHDAAGGAINATGDSDLQARMCLFQGNASSEGGAIRTEGSSASLLLSDSIFTDNSVGARINGGGGGGAIAAGGPATIERCTFSGNASISTTNLGSANGGALFLGGVCHISDSQFLDNQAWGGGTHPFIPTWARGGAISAYGSVTLLRCLVQGSSVGNAQTNLGGALSGQIDAIHCTFRGNVNEGAGASTTEEGSMTNCVVWGAAQPVLGSSVNVNHSIVQGGAPGVGILDLDPMFWGASDGHLMPGSPAIDAGDPNLASDPDGSIADLGAYPFDGTHCGPGCTGEIGTITCSAQPNSTGSASTLTAIGSTTAADDLLILHCSGLPADVFGFYLTSQNPGFIPGLGGGQGDLCLGPPTLLRFNEEILFSNAGGTMTQRERLAEFPMNTVVQAGESWHFQLWHRDTYGAGMPTSNTSPAVRVDF